MTTVNTQEEYLELTDNYIENYVSPKTNIRLDVTAAGYALLIKNNKFEEFHNYIKTILKGVTLYV